MEKSKTGYFSSAFVISAVVVVLSLSIAFGASLLEQDFFPPDSSSKKITTALLQAAGVLAAALTAAGYTMSNALTKIAEKKAEAVVVAADKAQQTAQIEKNKSLIDLEVAKANLQANEAAGKIEPPKRTYSDFGPATSIDTGPGGLGGD